jgi:dTDP-4-dehydrorhamnose reductase
MLGRDVIRAGSRRGHRVSGLTRAELDVCDPDAVAAALDRVQPALVINCAAWTDVDGAETAEGRALAVNAGAAGVLARGATAVGARMVHVSTDYVFDGQADRPYVESDPVGPRSAYGRTKLAGEREVLGTDGGHAVVRSSWLFGSGGGNFAATMLRLAGDGRDTVSVVTDQIGCPTFTGHLADALVELAERLAGDGGGGPATGGRGVGGSGVGGPGAGGVHHIAGSGRCSWNEFAVEIFAQAGVDCTVLGATSAEMARPAARPAWSVLGSERPDAIVLPAWEKGLAGYLAEIGRAAKSAGTGPSSTRADAGSTAARVAG